MTKILITNDDGINSDGLARLAAEAVKFGEVWVVAPDVFYADHYIETRLSNDRISYMVEGVRNYSTSGETDLKAIFDNYISIGRVTNIS
ncbi:MAG: 5'/3'-nucleotidase SurE [Agathobacter sp.]|nr:5'/3'-nucleotidase SurE [Agathobacter sp.]